VGAPWLSESPHPSSKNPRPKARDADRIDLVYQTDEGAGIALGGTPAWRPAGGSPLRDSPLHHAVSDARDGNPFRSEATMR